MRITLICHAESKHLEQGIIAGVKSCPGLTKHGIHQAQALAKWLESTGKLKNCSTLITSPVLRARETAEIILDLMPIENLEIDINLTELKPGKADGLSIADYQKKYGIFDLPSEPDRPFAPGGESWMGFIERVRNSMENLAGRYMHKGVVVVTHPGYIVASVLSLFNIPRPGTQTWLNPVHASLTEWQFSPPRWELIMYNETPYQSSHEKRNLRYQGLRSFTK